MRSLPPKTVSLWFELLNIIDALNGVHSLLDALTSDGFDSAKEARRLPIAAMAINNMVRLRLEVLCSVVRQEANPITLWAPHNEAGPVGLLGDDHDVRFEEWPPQSGNPARLKKAR